MLIIICLQIREILDNLANRDFIYTGDELTKLPVGVKYNQTYNLMRALNSVLLNSNSIYLKNPSKVNEVRRMSGTLEASYIALIDKVFEEKGLGKVLRIKPIYKKNKTGNTANYFAYPVRNSIDDFYVNTAIESPKIFLPIGNISKNSGGLVTPTLDTKPIINQFKADYTPYMSNKIISDIFREIDNFDKYYNKNIGDITKYQTELSNHINNFISSQDNKVMFGGGNTDVAIVTKALFNNNILTISTNPISTYAKSIIPGVSNNDITVDFDRSTMKSGHFFLTSNPVKKYYFKIENGMFKTVDALSGVEDNISEQEKSSLETEISELRKTSEGLLSELIPEKLALISNGEILSRYLTQSLSETKPDDITRKLALQARGELLVRSKFNKDINSILENVTKLLSNIEEINTKRTAIDKICKI